MRHSNVRRGLFCGVTVLAFALAGCGGSSPTGGGNGGGNGSGNGGGNGDPVETTSVTIDNTAFDPADIQVSPGATVTWTWQESVIHNVTFADPGIEDSGDRNSGTHSADMPSAAGEYSYQCTIHPSLMQGTVTVE